MTKIEKLLRAAIKVGTNAERVMFDSDGEVFMIHPRENGWYWIGPLDALVQALCEGFTYGCLHDVMTAEAVAYRLAAGYPAEGIHKIQAEAAQAA